MKLAFDLISDLNLNFSSDFHWEGKPTSLFCVIAGNISRDLDVVYEVLKHLSKLYRGVFFIDGVAEIGSVYHCQKRREQIQGMCSKFRNVPYLHGNVIVVDGVGLIGCNGFYGNLDAIDEKETDILENLRLEEYLYLSETIQKVQLHVDIKKIVVVTNSVPLPRLFYGEAPELPESNTLHDTLVNDTEKKITTWVYGTSDKVTDIMIDDINYVSNGCFGQNPYWPKRFEVEI